MDRLPARQIHLDFHTSEHMPDVGGAFSEENFREALRVGHISSITLFAKCHHGWAYFPSKVNKMHPTLKTNLLARQLKVCREEGVRAQIYVSAGLDERKAVEYPQFRNVRKGNENTLLGAHWHGLCLNNDEYLEMLKAEVAEVMETFQGQFDGIFMDLCTPTLCVCPHCINTMLALGLDPEKPEDLEKHRRMVYTKYTSAINEVVAKYAPDMPVTHNCGNLPRDDRDWTFANTAHLELESLPTGGWGYDHFPMSAAYCRTLGREFLGMTGKFHKSWGEFGGYKHPNALIYETGLSLANGAKCSVGDQLHPSGKFDLATYRLIGKAYAEVEKKEPWCFDAEAIADIAVYTSYTDATRNTCPDIGANRMLLENHYLYNIIDSETSFDGYKLIIFPDVIVFDTALKEKVASFLENGGKILLSGKSGTDENGSFFRDIGAEFLGENELATAYLHPVYDMEPNGEASYFMYSRGYNVKKTGDIKIFAERQDAYFDRSFRHFCSHANTPYDPDAHALGAFTSGGSVGYIAWNIFDEYGVHGAYHAKRIVCDMLDALLGEDKTVRTSLPSGGVLTLMHQKEKNRLVNHLLYAVTKKRGVTEVIEDAIPIYNTEVSVKLPAAPKKVSLVPEGKEIPFTYENGVLSYVVPEFTLHGMVAIEL